MSTTTHSMLVTVGGRIYEITPVYHEAEALPPQSVRVTVGQIGAFRIAPWIPR